ncbi:MAG: hypothetical protein WC748_09805 [Legionellales bacterium]|jgi:hypothetical protein
MKKLYYVFMAGEDWGVMVIAETSRQAKVLGYKFLKSEYDYSNYDFPFINCRVNQKKGVIIPENETGIIFDNCGVDNWLCHVWGYCYMDECPKYAEKLIQYGERYE